MLSRTLVYSTHLAPLCAFFKTVPRNLLLALGGVADLTPPYACDEVGGAALGGSCHGARDRGP
jgi:hypothetical protein